MNMHQFVRAETYRRTPNKSGQSVLQVLQEAARDPNFSMHVSRPAQPEIIYGLPPADVLKLHDELVEKARVRSFSKNGKEYYKIIQKTTHTLCAVVASFPIETRYTDPFDNEDGGVLRWAKGVLKWANKKWYDNLIGAVLHWDEAYPHIHMFILPFKDPEMQATRLHPGKSAKETTLKSALAEGMPKKQALKLANRAYREAMREFQNEYHMQVAAPNGQTRYGPRRPRLPPGEIKRQSNEALLRFKRELDEQADALARRSSALDSREQQMAEKWRKVAIKEKELAARSVAITAAERRGHDALIRTVEREKELLGLVQSLRKKINQAEQLGSKLQQVWASLAEFMRPFLQQRPGGAILVNDLDSFAIIQTEIAEFRQYVVKGITGSNPSADIGHRDDHVEQSEAAPLNGDDLQHGRRPN